MEQNKVKRKEKKRDVKMRYWNFLEKEWGIRRKMNDKES